MPYLIFTNRFTRIIIVLYLKNEGMLILQLPLFRIAPSRYRQKNSCGAKGIFIMKKKVFLS